MGSQKVPGTVLLHCNGRIYRKAHVIIFKVSPLRAHTLVPSILPLLETFSIYSELEYSGGIGSQKVPGMAVLRCNSRTYDNAYVISYKDSPLRMHTLAPSIRPLLEAPGEGLFRSSAVAFDLMSSMAPKSDPFRPIFRAGNSQKPLGAKSGG
jgi:hypothetical protein